MPDLIPKVVPDDFWKKITAQKAYAVNIAPDRPVLLRFGAGIGLYFSVAIGKSGEVKLKNIDYEKGKDIKSEVFAEGKKVVIGRTDQCQFFVKHAIVSRQHVELIVHKGVLLIKDVGSTNGTFLNKSPLYFDVEEYLQTRPVEKLKEMTQDHIRQEFGPRLDDFLMDYSKGLVK